MRRNKIGDGLSGKVRELKRELCDRNTCEHLSRMCRRVDLCRRRFNRAWGEALLGA